MEFENQVFKPGDKLSAEFLNYIQSVIGTLYDGQGDPAVSRVAVTKNGGLVGVDFFFVDGGSKTAVIAIDENDYPLSITANGNTATIEWSGL